LATKLHGKCNKTLIFWLHHPPTSLEVYGLLYFFTSLWERQRKRSSTNFFRKSRPTKYEVFKDTHFAVLTGENYHFKAKYKLRNVKRRKTTFLATFVYFFILKMLPNVDKILLFKNFLTDSLTQEGATYGPRAIHRQLGEGHFLA
jgi:hypothetical protein